jgi:hypothetical protein
MAELKYNPRNVFTRTRAGVQSNLATHSRDRVEMSIFGRVI